LGIVLVSLACGTPRDQSGELPAAQATNVRRTAVAQVQAIIANKSTPTAEPRPTATPTPSCPDAIWWTEARTHSGEVRTVQGLVVGARAMADGATLVEVGQPYSDPTGLGVVLRGGASTDLDGKTICAAGRISVQEGRTILQVGDRSSISVVN
jgi:hypothetical protein